jgi:5-methyltetrahydropteroyltriglutamate--homocysteine methyltransferase
MLTQNLGYPRIGANRELKKACEKYWAGKISEKQLIEAGKAERQKNWKVQKSAGIDIIPCNDFSFYDQVQDMTFMLGAIPNRFKPLVGKLSETDLYFALCRGYQTDGHDIIAMEMTKWFDTNYHYLVPEFDKNQTFTLNSNKVTGEYMEALAAGVHNPKPVLIGPVTYLLLGKEKSEGFDKLDLLDTLLEEYIVVLKKLEVLGCKWIQLDEPCLVTDLTIRQREAYTKAYRKMNSAFGKMKVVLATYYGNPMDNISVIHDLPVDCLHLDITRCHGCINEILNIVPKHLSLSLGLVDGRNIWKNNLGQSLDIISKVKFKIGEQRIIIAPSCSLLHIPYDLDMETDEKSLPVEFKQWMSFAKQKLAEVSLLKELSKEEVSEQAQNQLLLNKQAIISRTTAERIHNAAVEKRLAYIDKTSIQRDSSFSQRSKLQHGKFKLPLFPTTTIGSFPQTTEIRRKRKQFKNGTITLAEYELFLKEETKKTIEIQEQIGLDVLVHGEFERNDMVEYFGEQLDGFVFTRNGWVQSYGSRGVKPPVIIGDVSRKGPMTLSWSQYAQSLTTKKVKGMLTGPITILQWSFVRDDQPRETTAMQIALAIRDEVLDLEQAGIDIIQIDEPAIREGLPLRKSEWDNYLEWAVKAFRICCMGIQDTTQLHTHMCYAEFNDIIEAIAAMDADVITIETSRSQMELLEAFTNFNYPNQIGPGVYDIHSPRVPDVLEMEGLIEKAIQFIPKENLWINPDCGLKTRGWAEVKQALENMVKASVHLREKHS